MIFTLPIIMGITTISTSIVTIATYPCVKKEIQRRLEITRMKKFIDEEIDNMDEDSLHFMILQTTPEGIPEPGYYKNSNDSPVAL